MSPRRARVSDGHAGAVVATGRMRDPADQDRPQKVDAACSQVRTLGYVATPALVVTTGALAALHLRELKRGKAPAGSEWVLSVGSARHKALSYTVQTVYFWSNGRLR